VPVILWTDALFFLLLAGGVFFALFARKREHLRAPWRRVACNRLGMTAAVVLAAFLLVGILDSLHFRPELARDGSETAPRYSPEIISVLDVLLGSLRDRPEKTYSAPLARRSYSKETTAEGVGRDYPRLRYGGAHLGDLTSEYGRDVIARVAIGTGAGLLIWLAAVLGWLFWVARARGQTMSGLAAQVLKARTRIPWREMLLALLAILTIGGITASLADGYHVLGTDKIGEDVLYQALKGVRTGLLIGTLTTLVMLPAALILGTLAGYFGGWVDDVVQYVYTTLSSIPGVLLIAAAILMLDVYMGNHPDAFTSLTERADLRLLFLCLILGVTSWTSLCRLLRGESLKLREADYVLAARALGVSHAGILARHILPNVMHIVLITLVLDFSGLVLAEAVLAYVNIGVDPTMYSWGNMINSARLELAREPAVWWSLAAAFGFMLALVLAANLFADAVRDAFDPRLRGAD